VTVGVNRKRKSERSQLPFRERQPQFAFLPFERRVELSRLPPRESAALSLLSEQMAVSSSHATPASAAASTALLTSVSRCRSTLSNPR